MAVGVTVDASAAYLQRQGLATLADGAALAGADNVEGAAVYRAGLGDGRAPLDADAIHDAVVGHLRELGAYDEFPGLALEVTVADEAVLVRLVAPLDLPISVAGLTDARVAARGSAVVRIEAGP
ncbi:hypothetical protein IE331_03920 [Nocardioides sp. MJB4]|uniref:Putative Flp pilus-assembly TadG-like N-terminal domain-containing protein n=2 Tax=Nocardioides donggukensis TaxID=2774019 RepID=A0A927K1R1_9ACTN|nr:hypothetical protein [Nocardioides donggukensis]